MKNAMKVDTFTYMEAGLAAVQLLHKLVGLCPLRSDTRKIRAEITQIESAFRDTKKDGTAVQVPPRGTA